MNRSALDLLMSAIDISTASQFDQDGGQSPLPNCRLVAKASPEADTLAFRGRI